MALDTEAEKVTRFAWCRCGEQWQGPLPQPDIL